MAKDKQNKQYKGKGSKPDYRNKGENKDYRGESDVTKNTRKCISEVDPKVVNDPKWYAKNQQLLKDAASLSFGRALGNSITFNPNANPNDGQDSISTMAPYFGGLTDVDTKATVPGIMRINLMPCYGVSADNNSALNLAIRNVYSYVRHANSGHSNYDAPDLGLYLMAMDNAYTLWAWMVRLYGLMMTYNGLNRYYPKAIIESMGFNFSDMEEHLNDLRTYINIFGVKLSSLYVPTTMPVFVRHQWLYRNVYLDAPTGKAQTYYFAPAGYLEYNEYDGAGKLDFVKIPHSGLTYAQIREICDRVINKLLESEDIGIMSGDILKAYGVGNTFSLSAIPETYTVTPEYSEEVLMQIHNMEVMSLPRNYNVQTFGITQDVNSGALIYKPKFVAARPGYDYDQLMDLYTADTSPDHVMVATRLQFSAHATGRLDVTMEDPNGEEYTIPGVMYEVDSCGSELVASTYVYVFSSEGDLQLEHGITSNILAFNDRGWYVVSSNDICDSATMIKLMSYYATFDWAPMTRLWVNVNNDTERSIKLLGYINDLDNYTLINDGTLNNIHDVALLSLLDVPAGV